MFLQLNDCSCFSSGIPFSFSISLENWLLGMEGRFPKDVTPECSNRGFDFAHHDPEPSRTGRGSSSGFPLDSRLKHAGMTDSLKVAGGIHFHLLEASVRS